MGKAPYHGSWQRDLAVTIWHTRWCRYPTAKWPDGYDATNDITKGYAAYVCGALPPRYPVPAIPIYCYIGYDEVFTAEQHDDGIRDDWGWKEPRRYFRS